MNRRSLVETRRAFDNRDVNASRRAHSEIIEEKGHIV